MSIKKFIPVLLLILTFPLLTSCSPSKNSSHDDPSEDFNINEYMLNSRTHEFSFSHVLDYILHINNIDEYSIHSLSFSISHDRIDSFSISISHTGSEKGILAIYHDGIFRNRLVDLDESLSSFDENLVSLADLILSLDEFSALNLSEFYFLSELSSGEIELSYLSAYDFFLLDLDESKLIEVSDSELSSLNSSLVFSAYQAGNDTPKYILFDY